MTGPPLSPSAGGGPRPFWPPCTLGATSKAADLAKRKHITAAAAAAVARAEAADASAGGGGGVAGLWRMGFYPAPDIPTIFHPVQSWM